MIHRTTGLALGAVLLLTTACLTPIPPGATRPYTEPEYRVAPPDQISVTVRPAPEIERQFTIRPDGFIAMDLIGDVFVQGKTIIEIRDEIDEIFVQLAVYAGVPFALAGAGIADQVFAERDGTPERNTPPAPLELKDAEKRRADGLDFLRTLLGNPDLDTKATEASILDHQGVAIRTGHHCAMPVMQRFGIPGTARASLALYNNRDDVDRLVAALHKAREMFA